jgi:hypothetical protein
VSSVISSPAPDDLLPLGDQQEVNTAFVPAIPDKKKRKSVADPETQALSDLGLLSSKGLTSERTEKKKKKKRQKQKIADTDSEESTLPSMHASPGESLQMALQL